MLNFLIEDFNAKNLNKRKDKHFDNLVAFIEKIATKKGFRIYERKRIEVEDFSKKLDIYFESPRPDGTEHKHAIELKSISSSFGKNFNNRIEEMIGQAWIFKNIFKINKVGYVFVYHDVKEEYSYYSRLKTTIDKCVAEGLLDSCLLIKLSGKDIYMDPDYYFETFLYGILN